MKYRVALILFVLAMAAPGRMLPVNAAPPVGDILSGAEGNGLLVPAKRVGRCFRVRADCARQWRNRIRSEGYLHCVTRVNCPT